MTITLTIWWTSRTMFPNLQNSNPEIETRPRELNNQTQKSPKERQKLKKLRKKTQTTDNTCSHTPILKTRKQNSNIHPDQPPRPKRKNQEPNSNITSQTLLFPEEKKIAYLNDDFHDNQAPKLYCTSTTPISSKYIKFSQLKTKSNLSQTFSIRPTTLKYKTEDTFKITQRTQEDTQIPPTPAIPTLVEPKDCSSGPGSFSIARLGGGRHLRARNWRGIEAKERTEGECECSCCLTYQCDGLEEEEEALGGAFPKEVSLLVTCRRKLWRNWRCSAELERNKEAGGSRGGLCLHAPWGQTYGAWWCERGALISRCFDSRASWMSILSLWVR